jgi:predicted HicB family RNase H-like nuclease
MARAKRRNASVDKYTYRVRWSEEDAEFVGTCAELPGLSWLDADPDAAFHGIRRVAEEAVSLLEKAGDSIPEPLAMRAFSGVFKVRVPPDTHRRLAIEAAEAHVSLNRIASEKLAR